MPLYSIFSKTKPKKQNQNKQRPLIIADIHEKNSLVLAELYSDNQIQLIIQSLKIGDYLIGDTIIERKTISDFVSSMINKRLAQQLNQMQVYKQKILILEGSLEKVYLSRLSNAIRGFILSIINNYKIPIIFTQDYEDTAKYLITLTKQQSKKPNPLTFHSKIPKTIKEQKQYVLESFPNIGPVKAKKLIEEFKTLSNIFNAKEEEIIKILRKNTEEFKRLLDS